MNQVARLLRRYNSFPVVPILEWTLSQLQPGPVAGGGSHAAARDTLDVLRLSSGPQLRR